MFQVAIKRENIVAEIQKRLFESWSFPDCHLLLFVENVSSRTEFLMGFSTAGQDGWQVPLPPPSFLGTELEKALRTPGLLWAAILHGRRWLVCERDALTAETDDRFHVPLERCQEVLRCLLWARLWESHLWLGGFWTIEIRSQILSFPLWLLNQILGNLSTTCYWPVQFLGRQCCGANGCCLFSLRTEMLSQGHSNDNIDVVCLQPIHC